MALKFFGQFLLEQGAITRDQLLDAVKYQGSIVRPLCALAIERGYLTKEQIAKLDAEHQGSDKKFIEIALHENILTFQQMEELHKIKSERWVFLGEALANRGHLTLSRMNELFEEYRKGQPVEDSFLSKTLASVPEHEIITAMLQVTVDLFIHYTKQIVEVLAVEEAPIVSGDSVAYVFAQKVAGDKNFDYAMALPEMLTLAIASHMMGEEMKEVNATVLDAVSEFVNVVIGNGCTKLCLKNFKVHAEPPRIMTRESISKLQPKNTVVVIMKTMKGEFQVLFLFQEGMASASA